MVYAEQWMLLSGLLQISHKLFSDLNLRAPVRYDQNDSCVSFRLQQSDDLVIGSEEGAGYCEIRVIHAQAGSHIVCVAVTRAGDGVALDQGAHILGTAKWRECHGQTVQNIFPSPS